MTNQNSVKRGLYGRVFKEIRLQHGEKQSTFESIGISSSSISRFEAGQHMMTIDKIDVCLRMMHVPLREYEYLINGYSRDDQEDVFLEIEEAVLEDDRAKMVQIQKAAPADRLLKLAIKTKIDGLTRNEQVEVYDAVMEVSFWDFYYLSIVSLVIDKMRTTLIFDIMDLFWDKNVNFYNIFRYRRKILQSSHRAAAALITRGEEKEAKLILDISKGELRENDNHTKIMHLFVEGYYNYRFVDKAAGKKDMEDAIKIFERLESYQNVTYLKRFYHQHVR